MHWAADTLGRSYRGLYFLRRFLVTWIEFCGVLRGVTRTREFKLLSDDEPTRIAVLKALDFFDQHKQRVADMRNNFGGHLLTDGVNFALRAIPADIVAKTSWNPANTPFGLELHYAADLMGGIWSSKLPDGETSSSEMWEIVLGAGPLIQEVTYCLVSKFVWPRFGR